MVTYLFEIKGVTPLLMNSSNKRDKFRVKITKRTRDDRDTPDSWKRLLYADDTSVVMPSRVLMASLINAGRHLEYSGSNVKYISYAEPVRSSVTPKSNFFDFYIVNDKSDVDTRVKIDLHDIMRIEGPFEQQAKEVEKLGFNLYVKNVRVKGKSILRVRPKFDSWLVSGQLDVDDKVISENLLTKLFTISGQHVGLGDWRPSSPKKPGPFGKFELLKLLKVK